MEAMNLNYIKQLLIKLDTCTYEEKKEIRQFVIDYIKKVIEENCNTIVEDIKINKDGCYGFTVNTINKLSNSEEYIKFAYIAHSGSCRIMYNGKFEVNIKL